MAYELKDMSGSLFRNNKQTSTNSPQARGTARIDGVDYWVSAWTKTTKDGDRWQSLSFQRKEEQPQRARSSYDEAPPRSMADELDDEVPF